jgi:superfamily I DNA and/or RNA helicase
VQINSHAVNDLRSDLQRVRRQLKVRQLLSRHSQVIRMLMPCTIASPNSIAMLLDVTSQQYDVVISDEASQIRVTSAICGIGRANCAVIVGDSKQMPPTSIAEKALFDETDDIDETTVMTKRVFCLNVWSPEYRAKR